LTAIALLLYKVKLKHVYKAVGVRTGWEHASRTVFEALPLWN